MNLKSLGIAATIIFCSIASAYAQVPTPKAETENKKQGSKSQSLEELLFGEKQTGRIPTSGSEPKLELQDTLFQESDSEESASERSFFASNFRWTIDVASRPIIDTLDQDLRSLHAIGLDIHKVFSTDTSDIGTLVAQLYLTRVDRISKRPFFFDDDHDWELVFRIFNFNLTRLADGKVNIRVGHFDMPYGIEYTINTNGTLRQFTTVQNLGLKNDFGFSLNGVLSDFEYEFALTRGTWNEYFQEGQPYILSGRIGTPREENLIIGLSTFYGEVSQPIRPLARIVRDDIGQQKAPRAVIRRKRVGLDIQYYFNSLGFLLESSCGTDFSKVGGSSRGLSISNNFLEINWQAKEDVFIYVQNRSTFRFVPRGADTDAINASFGIRYTPAILKITATTNWAFSAQITQTLSTPSHSQRGLTFAFQIRLRL
jgi:hypothetical protein